MPSQRDRGDYIIVKRTEVVFAAVVDKLPDIVSYERGFSGVY